MARRSRGWLLACVTVTACSNPEVGALDTAYTSSTGTDSGTGEPEPETETGEPEPDPEPLRFVAAGATDGVIVALDLGNPLDIPPYEYVATDSSTAIMFGPTPFGTHPIVRDQSLEQLVLTPEAELTLEPFAEHEGAWIGGAWFGDAGANALVNVGVDAITGPHMMLWIDFSEGELLHSYDITPPTQQPGGSLMIAARSPDSRWAVAEINIQPNDIWDLHLLAIDAGPSESFHVTSFLLPGVPAVGVPGFLSVVLDDERLVYRQEQLENIWRPYAVDLDDPNGEPVSIWPNLPHTYSITAAPGDASRLLVTTDGSKGYHELRLIELDGPTSAQPPITLTEPGGPALENTQPGVGAATIGHGFDALGRIFYVRGALPAGTSVGVSLVSVSDGAVADRLELIEAPANAEIAEVVWDEALQLLGCRVQNTSTSWIEYVDLSAEQPESIRLDPFFDHAAAAPEDQAKFGWSADGSRIAAVGTQQGTAAIYVAALGDPVGTTTKILLPNVEDTSGYAIDHQPMLSPNGDQVLLWYGTLAGRNGLIHAPTEGASAAEVVLASKHFLSAGAYMPRTPY